MPYKYQYKGYIEIFSFGEDGNYTINPDLIYNIEDIYIDINDKQNPTALDFDLDCDTTKENREFVTNIVKNKKLKDEDLCVIYFISPIRIKNNPSSPFLNLQPHQKFKIVDIVKVL